MLPEISLNVMDLAQNSIKAEATLIQIRIAISHEGNSLYFELEDNGYGMTPEQVEQVTDPFFTSRTTRKVGLGVPFIKQEAEATGGSFTIESEKNVGTILKALFYKNSIDCMPLGDICSTIHLLVIGNEEIDWIFDYKVDDEGFVLDTREFKEVLGGMSFQLPEVSQYIKEYLKENLDEVNKGEIF